MGESEKSWEKWNHFVWGKKEHHFLEGSQISLACPSDKGVMEMETLEWLEVVPWEKGHGNFISWINVKFSNLEK